MSNLDCDRMLCDAGGGCDVSQIGDETEHSSSCQQPLEFSRLRLSWLGIGRRSLCCSRRD